LTFSSNARSILVNLKFSGVSVAAAGPGAVVAGVAVRDQVDQRLADHRHHRAVRVGPVG